MSETARAGLGTLWSRLFHRNKTGRKVDLQAELRSAPDHLLNKIASAPDLDEPTEALNSALHMLDSEQQEESIRVVIGPPGSGTGSILKNWALRQKLCLIVPPSPDQILHGGDDWLAGFGEGDNSPVVFSCLERCYLRHYNGLIVIRKLLDLVRRHDFRCVIGCQSWAWAYLCKSAGIDSILPSPLVLQAFDGGCLQNWLWGLAM